MVLPLRLILRRSWTVPAWPCPSARSPALASRFMKIALAFLVRRILLIAASSIPYFKRPPLLNRIPMLFEGILIGSPFRSAFEALTRRPSSSISLRRFATASVARSWSVLAALRALR